MKAEQQPSSTKGELDFKLLVGKSSHAYFSNSLEHVFAELERIDLLLQFRLQQVQDIFDNDNYYRGLYITQQDVERVFKKPIGEPCWKNDESDLAHQQIKLSLKLLESRNKEKELASKNNGVQLSLLKITTAFKLSSLEKDILLLALAPEIDLRYETMFAYLQDDIGKKYLSVDLLLNIVGQSALHKIDVRQCLSASSTLIKYQLINLVKEPSQQHQNTLSQLVKVSSRLIDCLLSENENTCRELVGANWISITEPLVDEYFHPKSLESIKKYFNRRMQESSGSFLFIQGAPGAGRCRAAFEIAKSNRRKLLGVDLELYLKATSTSLKVSIQLVKREAMINNADIYFTSLDKIPENSADLECLFECLFDFCGDVYFEYDKNKIPNFEILSNTMQRNIYHLELLNLTSNLRAKFWQYCISSCCENYTKDNLIYLSERFRFTPKSMVEVVATAKQISKKQRGSLDTFQLDELYEACRLNSNRKLESLAKCIVPKYQWDDIILEDDKLRQLQELCNTVLHRTKVFEDWGFSEKLSLGKGVNVLFTGPPGTGKTMAAEVIAGRLKLDLYKIDLSTIVSKYIGETQKNIAKIFSEAETSNAILFFDEADALFSKRTEIKSSNDRHSNSEVAFLLQRMEEFDGITILATNLKKNIDEAFVRRLAFIVKFSFPSFNERSKIWRTIWPKLTPISEDVDFDFMAKQFKLAGGDIKNIAVASAFLAAQNTEVVGMKHLVQSTKREFEKQGRTSVKADFGCYGELLS